MKTAIASLVFVSVCAATSAHATNGHNPFIGPQGPAGVKGDKGDQGPRGLQGERGATGATGATGPQGPQGIQGVQGVQGIKGDTGATGAAGLNGAAGPKGDKGDKGDRGIAGVNGTNGIDGAAGPAGLNGADGTNGLDGKEGAAGAPATLPEDVVTVQQMTGAVAASQAYTQVQVNSLRDEIRGVAKSSYGGVASAMALQMPSINPLKPDALVMRLGVGSFKGESAIGVSFRKSNRAGDWSFTGGISRSSGGTGVAVGVEHSF